MNNKELNLFFEKFNLRNNFRDLKLVNNNLFNLSKITKNQVYGDDLLFLKLNKLVPSIKLLTYISENSKNKVEIINRKKAIDFTYGKNLSLDSIVKFKLEKNKYYLIFYQKKIIGVVEFNGFELKNIFNLGDYLKEN